MEVGAPVFAPIKVVEEKDKAVNVARQNAKLEYDRIMEQAEVLMRQARALQARLDATEMVHRSKFSFNPLHGKIPDLIDDEVKLLIKDGHDEKQAREALLAELHNSVLKLQLKLSVKLPLRLMRSQANWQ